MIEEHQAKVIVRCRDQLGESAFWSPIDKALYWSDGYAPELHRFDSVTNTHTLAAFAFDTPVGVVARALHGFVVGTAGGLHYSNFSGTEVRVIADPEHGRDGVAYNDGKADRSGNFWFGSYDTGTIEPRGAFWRLDKGGCTTLVDSGYSIFNGPAFSPDGQIAYASDSNARRIIAYDVSNFPPYLTHRRVFFEMGDIAGLPDGLTVDAAGGLWCAMWGGYCAIRIDPTGELTDRVAVSAAHATSVALGGADLRTLFITSATCELSSDELEEQPDAGCLFGIEVNVPGLPEHPVELFDIAHPE